jgi:predicted nucleic acid-binding Zn ribbon protein
VNGLPRRGRRPDHGPQPVASFMAKVLTRLGAPPSLDTMEVIFTRWTEVVGPELAAHVHPVRVNGSVLVIGADHPAWVTRCRMDSEHILAAARDLGDTTVQRIEVVLQRPQ